MEKELQKPYLTDYRLQFIERARFMAGSLSNLVNNLAERIHKIKWKCGHNNTIAEFATPFFNA